MHKMLADETHISRPSPSHDLVLRSAKDYAVNRIVTAASAEVVSLEAA